MERNPSGSYIYLILFMVFRFKIKYLIEWKFYVKGLNNDLNVRLKVHVQTLVGFQTPALNFSKAFGHLNWFAVWSSTIKKI